MSFVHVAVPVPQLDLLTYRVPEAAVPLAIGARVVVPLGSRMVTGIAVEFTADPPAGVAATSVKAIHRVLDPTAFLPPDVVALARWTADYYAAGAGETILAVLPPKTRGGRVDAHKTVRVVAITVAGLGLLDHPPDSRTRRLSPRQQNVLERLSRSGTGLAARTLMAEGIGADTVARLTKAGLVSIRHERVDRDPAALLAAPMDTARELTEEQSVALRRLEALVAEQAFRVALLHGITGSGKTEVYLQLATAVRSLGRRVLMLVPEIGLTPALVSLCRQRFGDRVAIQHSGLSDGERHDQWMRIRRGDVDVVVGTRSAVFAPVESLGLIVVDEEHDASYKQEESPRYNGRDVAIVRGQRAGALVVLGSATPSVETYHNAVSGRYERIVLGRRVFDRPLAAVRVVDMREEYAEEGPDVILSRALRAAIDDRLTKGEQALVLLNRRGFATSVFCRQCAGGLDCPNCSVSLVVHGEGHARRARCHYCDHSMRVPATCPLCKAPYMEQSGFGTERVEAEVKRLCPGAKVARLDRDTTRRKGALLSILSRFREGAIDVLVGTQMIAKGHDFPRVTLVGVVSADVGLGTADFRSSERTFQLLTQVAGRAGRGDQPGEAVVQTIYPGHYSIQLACLQDYPTFYEREMRFRRAMRYPPVVSLVNTIVRARSFASAAQDAERLSTRLRSDSQNGAAFQVLGPAPAPLGRLRGDYRAQLLMKGRNRKQMRQALVMALATSGELRKRVVVDVDPLNLL